MPFDWKEKTLEVGASFDCFDSSTWELAPDIQSMTRELDVFVNPTLEPEPDAQSSTREMDESLDYSDGSTLKASPNLQKAVPFGERVIHGLSRLEDVSDAPMDDGSWIPPQFAMTSHPETRHDYKFAWYYYSNPDWEYSAINCFSLHELENLFWSGKVNPANDGSQQSLPSDSDPDPLWDGPSTSLVEDGFNSKTIPGLHKARTMLRIEINLSDEDVQYFKRYFGFHRPGGPYSEPGVEEQEEGEQVLHPGRAERVLSWKSA